MFFQTAHVPFWTIKIKCRTQRNYYDIFPFSLNALLQFPLAFDCMCYFLISFGLNEKYIPPSVSPFILSVNIDDEDLFFPISCYLFIYTARNNNNYNLDRLYITEYGLFFSLVLFLKMFSTIFQHFYIS